MLRRSLAILSLLFAGAFPLFASTSSTATISMRRTTAFNGPVLAADFNGDGIVDVVTTAAPTAGSQILIAYGKGDGTFNTPVRTPYFGVPLAIGDFNNDGRPDIVAAAVATTGRWTLYVIANHEDGTSQLGQPAVQGSLIWFATPADVDGDGDQDIVVGVHTETADSVYVVPGNGDLTFRAPAVLTAGIGPHGAAVADFNGDNRNDIAVANHDGRTVTVFLNRGAFTFSPSDIAVDGQANDVKSADFNHDGRMDLLVAASQDGSDDLFYVSGSVVVLSGNGDGTFARLPGPETAPGPWRLVIGDFNRDGVPDIATVNRSAKQSVDFCGELWDSVSIIPGNGAGTFGPTSSFSLGDQMKVTDSRFRMTADSLVAADVDGDHQLDLLTSQGAILLNRPADPNWPPQVSPVASTPDPNDHSIQLQALASDSDQDRLSYQWSDDAGQPIEPTATPCRFVPQRLGVHRISVVVDDGHGHTATGSVLVDFGSSGGGTPPTVTVTSPAAGAIYDEGGAIRIEWSATSSAGVSRYSAALSTDDGGHFTPIADCTSLPATATSCVWRDAQPVTNFGRIAITATDNNGATGTGMSGRFVIRSAPGTSLPYGWSHADVGSVGVAGSASHDGFIGNGEGLTVSGSGADIWSSADEFHYVWQMMSGDFEIEARVASVQPINVWTKAGLMIRASATDPASPHASIFVTPGKGIAFQRRASETAISTNTSGQSLTAPVFLRMVRQGTALTAYYRKGPADQWTLIGQQVIQGLPSTVAMGLAVSSHADGTLATAKFDGVYHSAIPAWTVTEVGGAAGSASASNATIYTVKGSGSDIWGTADSFTYMWVPINGFVMITARVLGLDPTNAWAKAGLMVRESLAPGAKQVDAVITPGKGTAMQKRDATDGVSTNVSLTGGAPPRFLRMITSVQAETGRIVFVQANYSADGNIWHILGQAHVDMNPNAYIGIAVTSHDPSAQTTATLDTVRVER